MTVRVAFGIFAHNEAQDLPRLLGDLAAQDILADADVAVEFHLLANGCTDDTVAVARRAAPEGGLGDRLIVHDFAEGGKSRTWNRFVHEIAADKTEILGFLDADIRLTDPGHLLGLVRGLAGRADLRAFVSRPVADPVGADTFIARAILRGGGTSGDWRRAICGQCYLLTAEAARAIHLPVGLPVEDGFLRAMLLTDCMERLDGPMRIDGDPAIAHLFEPERTLSGFLRHQQRIVVGGAVNTALFTALRAEPDGTRAAELARASQDPGWLGRRLREQLPTRQYGWVPWSFLFKRARHMMAALRKPKDWLRLVRLPAYFCLDLIVYLRAQLRLARGIGENYW